MNGTATADNIPSSPAGTPSRSQGRQPPSPPGKTPYWYESPEKTEKYTAFQLLREQGFNPEKSAEMIGYAPATGWRIERQIKALRAKQADSGASVGFLTDKRKRTAAGVVDKLMRAKVFGDIKEIKDSTVLRAAECVLDRSDPKRSESSSGPSLSFVTINLGQYSPGSTPTGIGGPIVDVSPMVESRPSNPLIGEFVGDGI